MALKLLLILCLCLVAYARTPFPTEFYVHVVREAVEEEIVSSVPFIGLPANTPFALGYPSPGFFCAQLGAEYSSKELGRSQGTFIVNHLQGMNSTITINLVFHGFTGYILTSGAFDFSVPDNTMIILGGTGDFIGVRGYYSIRLVRRYPESTRSNSLLHGELQLC